jgi:hypothetical protein
LLCWQSYMKRQKMMKCVQTVTISPMNIKRHVLGNAGHSARCWHAMHARALGWDHAKSATRQVRGFARTFCCLALVAPPFCRHRCQILPLLLSQACAPAAASLAAP